VTASQTHSVVCRFADGVEQTVQVPPEATVLAVALSAEIPVLHQCQSGSCGSCVGRLVAGDVRMRSDTASSLLKSEQAEGLRLMCVSQVCADSVVQFAYPSTLSGPALVNTFVNAIDWLAPDVARLRLELAEGDWIDFSPGQFVRLRVPGSEQWRTYSMASTPDDLPKVDFLVRCLPEGVMSDYLRNEAAIDDVMKLEGAFGSFFLRDDMAPPHIMIAGGTGLAPVLSMLDVIRQRSGKKPNVILSFGCLDESTLFATEDLELRDFWMRELDLRISIDRGDASGPYRVGNPVEAISIDDVSADTVAYLCGPPGMISAAFEHLRALGVQPANIHAERFVASE
jgi:benzoate/toluate 1,2-dioxygenase reductase subunit